MTSSALVKGGGFQKMTREGGGLAVVDVIFKMSISAKFIDFFGGANRYNDWMLSSLVPRMECLSFDTTSSS